MRTSTAGSRDLPGCRGARFTLLEILLVLAILSLILAVVLPRIGRMPKRLLVERVLSSLRVAVAETGVRARASGQGVQLVLDVDGSQFLVQPMPSGDLAQRVALGGMRRNGESRPGEPDRRRGLIPATSSYDIPGDVEWRTDWIEDDTSLDEDGRPVYAFYPDGQATGVPIVFSVAGRTFEFDVDRLTGHAEIVPVEDR